MLAKNLMCSAPNLSALLAEIVSVSADKDVRVSGLSENSALVKPGDLFLAAPGVRTHGLVYLNQAIQRGAAAILWEPHVDIPSVSADCSIPNFSVPGLRQHIGIIADRFYGHPSRDMTVIGVTGTDGKTSVSQFVAQALHASARPCGVIGTLGYGLFGELNAGPHTTPDPITLQRELDAIRTQGAKHLVMEVSSHALDQGRVNGTAFDLAILTNISRDHFDYHGNLEAYVKAKKRLFEIQGLRYAILNMDDEIARGIADDLSADVQVFGYTLGRYEGSVSCLIRASHLEMSGASMQIRLATPVGNGMLDSRLLGRFNVANTMATLAVLLILGWSLDEALVRLAELRPVAGRMESFGGKGKPLVLVDYAHTPAALEHVLSALRDHCHGELWCVFGCGGDRDPGKRPQMAQVAECLADKIIITDDNPRTETSESIVHDIIAGISNFGKVDVIHDRGEAISLAISQAKVDDIVLIAGKGHEETQIIGDLHLPFSDRKVAQAQLNRRSI